MTAAPLVADGFGRRYSRRRPWAACDISVMIPANSITALVGPNGAGKSTLLRACIGFEPADAGRILVFGIDPKRDRASAIATTGYVPQTSSLYRSLSIGDHFVLARAARSTFDSAYAISRIEAAGLDVHRTVASLSGGEQAQVALALALGSRAPLLLLDEPLANLDPLARRDFLTVVVDDIRARGATAVLSSHIVTDIEQACDRIIVLSAGRVALDDSITVARSSHRTVTVGSLAGIEAIGAFAGPTGESLAIVRADSTGRESTLEEVVLGYLASSRDARQVRA